MSEQVKPETEIPADAPSARPRGRPRSETARQAILDAAREALEEGGLLAVTMEGVAARAGVGKPTVYRHWSNRYELAMAALIAASGDVETPSPAAAPLDALRAQLHQMAALFASGTGRHVAAVIASGYGETELSKAFRSLFVQARREEGRTLLRRAIEAREIRADVALETVLDLVYGPIFYRLTMGHGAVDGRFVDGLIDELVKGIGTKR